MSIREIKVTNTLSGKREILQTLTPGKLTMYSCGPTVYGLIHIGNLRTAVVSDLFFRYFKRVGYDVTYVRNYTDIDDKIIKRANDEGVKFEEITKKYISEVELDYSAALMEDPTHKTLATEHIPGMLEMIQKIIDNGKAYEVNGEVFFSVGAFEGYGKLSKKPLEDLEAGARVEINENKRNPLDFSLWKPAKPGEPSWDSPWGKGRPGWHIECSVMASQWMGAQIDVHHGAEDLIFPHHENEIAQSEAASGKDPFVKYWVHNRFLTMDKEKMSKSLGNIFTARDFLTKFGGELTRYMYLSVHYRHLIDFGPETIENAIASMKRIYEAKSEALRVSKLASAQPDPQGEAAWGEFAADCDQTSKEIDNHYANDFNTAGALGSLFTLIRKFNGLVNQYRKATPAANLAAVSFLKILEEDIGGVMVVGHSDPQAMLKKLSELSAGEGGGDRPAEDEIQKLIEERLAARKSKDFARSDSIRDDLLARGVALKDGPDGTSWSYK